MDCLLYTSNRRFYYKPEEVKRLIPLVGTLYPHGR